MAIFWLFEDLCCTRSGEPGRLPQQWIDAVVVRACRELDEALHDVLDEVLADERAVYSFGGDVLVEAASAVFDSFTVRCWSASRLVAAIPPSTMVLHADGSATVSSF